jgi:glycosyltransferase involved in cell wall biosynthesis
VKILYLIPDLNFEGAARQLTLLAAGLPAGVERRVVALGDVVGFNPELKRAGVASECLGWRRLVDLHPWRRLRAMLREYRPHIVHAWRPASLRLLRLLGGWSGPVILSAPFERGQRPDHAGWLSRWLLRGAQRLVAQGEAEAAACRRLGIPADQVVVIPPGVTPAPEPAPRTKIEAIIGQKLGTARLIVGLGMQDRHKGYSDAIWAFDILRYVIPDIHLLLIGNGPHHDRLRDFVRNTGLEQRIHLPGWRGDAAALLAAADVVWAPSWRAGGINVVLEAMAASRPVVAAALPELTELIRDGQTGVLYPVADKPALARQTRILLENEEQRRWLGAAARGHALQQFPVSALVERHVKLYQTLGGG